MFIKYWGPFHEKSYDKNRRKSKGEIIHKMFDNDPNQIKVDLNHAEYCIFS